MSRNLGEARVSILPDGTRFKPEAEAAVKKATAGLSGMVELKIDPGLRAKLDAAVKRDGAGLSTTVEIKGDAKDLDAKLAAAKLKADALSRSLGNLKVKDDSGLLAAMAKQADNLRNNLDKVGDSTGLDKAAKQIDKLASDSDRARTALGKITFAEEEAGRAAQNTAAKVQNLGAKQAASFDKAAKSVSHFADAVHKNSALKDDVVIKVKLDQTLSDLQAADLRIKLDHLKTNVPVSLNTKGADAEAVGLREKLKALLSGITAKVKAQKDDASFSGIVSFIGGPFKKAIAKAASDASSSGGSSLASSMVKTIATRQGLIVLGVAAGLAALPAALGATGVLAGVALGAGIVFSAQKLISSQLQNNLTIGQKQVTVNTDLATISRLESAKKLTALQQQQLAIAKQKLPVDQQALAIAQNQSAGLSTKQLLAYQKAFSSVDAAIGRAKAAFLQFALVATRPFLKPFVAAIDYLSKQLKGPLATSFAALFKAVGPLIKPVVESLVLLVQGVLPGLTFMLNKARGPLGDLFLKFGKLVGLRIGDWFKAAAPYIQVSGKYLLVLVDALGKTVTWLIKFGGESAKAFAGSQFQGFGGILLGLANVLTKLLIPAFEGWTGVMLPVIKDIALILLPLLNLLASSPGLVKALAAIAAGWFLVSKAVTYTAIAMKLLGFSTETILAVAPWVALAAAIIIAVVLIIKYWKPISGFFVKIWKDIWNGFIGPMINFFSKTIPSMFKTAVGWLQKNFVTPFTNFFTKTIPHAFQVTLDWLRKNWPLLLGIIGGPFGEAVGLVVKYHAQILHAIEVAWAHIKNAILGVVKPIGSVIAGVWNGVLNVTKSAWGHIENVITGAAKPIGSVLATVWGSIVSTAKRIWSQISKVIEIEVLIIVGIVGQAWRGIKNLTGIVWPWIYNTTKSIWGHIENAITGVVKPIVGAVVGGWNNLKANTAAAWNSIASTSKTGWGHIENAITGVVKPIVNWIKGAWDTLKNATAAAWNWITSASKTGWGHIENAVTGIVKPLVNWVKSAWDTLKNATAAAWNWIFSTSKTIWGRIENAIMGIVKPFVNWMKGAWDTLKNATAAAWNWILSTSKSVWSRISGAVMAIVKPMINGINGLWNTLKTWTKAAFNWIHDNIVSPLQKAWNWIENTFVKGVKGAFSGLVSSIKSIWSGIHAAISGPVNVVDGIWNKFAGFVNSGLHIFNIKKSLPTNAPTNFAKGGKIPGYAPGQDTVPAMLSPGEFVIRPEAVKAIGTGTLHALNSQGAHPYFPRKSNNDGPKKYAQGGSVPGDNQIVMDAEKYKGHKYVWGGAANPSTGWDCSSFVGYILGHDFGLRLPGGVKWNPNVHGPTANEYVNMPGFNLVSHNTNDIQAGDLLVEGNGQHVGFGTGPNGMFSAYDTALGTIASNANGMTNILRYHGTLSPNGPLSVIGGVLKKLAQAALSGVEGLVNGAMNHIPGANTPFGEMAKGGVDWVLNGAISALNNNPDNFTVPAGGGGGGFGPAGGATGNEMANGIEAYQYLLKNLFGGHKVAAAGAIASIWGESTWNPFAQGTGGRGLIGWTPPSTISNADFSGGMRTQLPAILRFVVNSGDSGVIASMFQATSVLQAANEWGRGVERFGINDVHGQGVALATQIMQTHANGGEVQNFATGGLVTPSALAKNQSSEVGDYGTLAQATKALLAHPNAYAKSHKATLTSELATITREQGAEAAAYKALSGKGFTKANLSKFGSKAKSERTSSGDKVLSTAEVKQTKALAGTLNALISQSALSPAPPVVPGKPKPVPPTSVVGLARDQAAENTAFDMLRAAAMAKGISGGPMGTLAAREKTEQAAYFPLTNKNGLSKGNLSKYSTDIESVMHAAADHRLIKPLPAETKNLTKTLNMLQAVIDGGSKAIAGTPTIGRKGGTSPGTTSVDKLTSLTHAQYDAGLKQVKGLSLATVRKSPELSHLWHLLHLQHEADLVTGGFKKVPVFDRGGTLGPGLNMVYNATGKPEHVVPTSGDSKVTLEFVGGSTPFEQTMLELMRKFVRVKGAGNVQTAFGRRN